jgi:hypothetical protein
MIYAYVENNQIVQGPQSLPNSWNNISGLDKASSEELLALGWLPCTLVEVPVGPNQVLDGSTFQVFSDRVVETQLVRDMTVQEIEDRTAQYNDQQKKNRSLAYECESDPIFFKWQRGEASQEEWLAEISSIKNRYPYQE